MANTHIAHDCVVGDDNVFANNVGVAGHVQIGNHIIIGGNSGIHQFCKVDDKQLNRWCKLNFKGRCRL